MRLWSLHPSLLDRIGLVALWREALLAQKVLLGATKGYRHHPQLDRFRQSRNPIRAIGCYLWSVVDEAKERGYHFDSSKIAMRRGRLTIQVTRGQLAYELEHLRMKLRRRNQQRLHLAGKRADTSNPMFTVVDGPVEPWERSLGGGSRKSSVGATFASIGRDSRILRSASSAISSARRREHSERLP